MDKYLHMTRQEFIKLMNDEGKCPGELGFKVSSATTCDLGETESICSKCWEVATEGMEFKNELMTFEKKYLPALQEFAYLERKLKELERDRKALKENIKEKMEENEIASFKNDFMSVTYSKATKVKKFDEKSFKQDYPELYEKYLVDKDRSASVTFRVK